ncbi:hypothetical protein N7495_009679 [Penicillium taxi]|uniref:uncharacterized protein n=1 Tax=Penicillium taxi TaxID=168475 RepID=UPI002545BB5D|nr:uncharacterized protein N7495_009679 [Penicillium taxi]KAJ5885169.1 hypothetical protein N7495_009679 [Penicillium taxi]
MRLFTLLQALLVVSVVANPLGPKDVQPIEKRENPRVIGTGFNSQQRLQIRDALSDILHMTHYVLSASDDVVNYILPKYFRADDKTAVTDVFRKIAGSDYSGASVLRRLTIKADQNDPYVTDSDREEDDALVINGEGATPRLVIFPEAFKKGGIDKPYSGVSAVTCNSIGAAVSENMETLASVILHEYMHYKALVVPPLRSSPMDLENGYGPYNTRFVLPKNQAIHNADSFAWYALELYWTMKCGRYFQDPENCLVYY